MITLKKLSWDNCFSYGKGNELILNDNTVTQIIGTNGMGKSSIPLIIEEVLYNKNSKGIKKADIPNRYVNDGYTIKLEFSKGLDEYCISVDRRSSIKVILEENGEDISSHTATNTYKTLQQIIGVDFKTFSQLVYQNTNASLQFLTATDSNRKKFLIDLLHLEDYVELFEIFKDASKEANILITGSKSKVATIEKWLKDNKLEDTNIHPIKKVEISTEEDEKELSSLLLEIKNISENNKKISKNNGLINILKELDLQKAESEAPSCKLPTTELRESLFAAKAKKDNAVKALKKIVGLGNTCHVCDQSIDEEFKRNIVETEIKARDEAQSTIEELTEAIKTLDIHNRKVDAFEKLEEDWSNTFRSIDRGLPSRIQNEDDLKEKAEQLSNVLKEKRKEIKLMADQNTEITKRNTRIQVIQEQTQEFITQLGEATKTLNQHADLDSNLEVLKKAFSTNGLLAYKIENLVVELEEVANTYLAELSDGRFTLGFNVQKDKLNVEITDNGNIVDILALSSGELARVNTATLIAIRKLMSSISKSKINILFLDEVINVLDDVGREKMVELLIKEDELNTYVVSHGWTHPLLDKIEVVKDGNVSKLEW
jgi:DNA repair exonuclease SbcCD ATPase subunit